ncbi:protein HEG [Lepisosteus oculatus]|uniref:protein HEG n=1 Tax=Lepisosteus oculatus TaxID=7918 RepID=UPI0035F52CE2
MATCTWINAATLLVMVLSVFKCLCAGSYTARTDPDWITTGESTDFTTNATGFGESTVLPSDVGSTTTASPSRFESASPEKTDSFSGSPEERQTLAGASTATEHSPQTDVHTGTHLEEWKSPSQTDSTYISSRTLLSLSTNSTSPYAEGTQFSDHSQMNTGRSEPWNSTEGDLTTSELTSTGPEHRQSTKGSRHLTTHVSSGENPSTGPPNVTHPSLPTTSDSTPNATPPLNSSWSITEDPETSSSAVMSQSSPSSSKTGFSSSSSSSSVPPSLSSNYSVPFTNSSWADGGGSVTSITHSLTDTDTSTGPPLPRTDNNTDGNQSLPPEDVTHASITTGPPSRTESETTAKDPSTEIGSSESLVTNGSVTELFTSKMEKVEKTTVENPPTTQKSITERTPLTEQDTQVITTSPPVTTRFYAPGTTEETRTIQTEHSTSWATTSQPLSTDSTSQHLSPAGTEGTHTQVSLRTSVRPTNVSTLVLETSTATPGKTPGKTEQTTGFYRSTMVSSTVTSTSATEKLTEKATTITQLTSTTAPATTTLPPVNKCQPNPCANGGKCSPGKSHCICPSSWRGDNCTEDVDECVSSPCPSGSTCVNTKGSFTCECPLGYSLEKGRTCNRAKTFLGTFTVKNVHLANTTDRRFDEHEMQREIIQMLNASLSLLGGYSKSTVTVSSEADGIRCSAVNIFSVTANVTSVDVLRNINEYLKSCTPATTGCCVVHRCSLSYRADSLCAKNNSRCDTERSTCGDSSGIEVCECLPGYFKYSAEDLSCRACNDGYKLENGTCVSCPFGFGGFNCGNFYKLIALVVFPAGGGLLLILLIVLIVTCCRKDKNDISKLIFKSGEFQMSPYAEYPKSNRISVEWGRETIEMQENGSTKNLLQMTDIYYSPALRNHELERNGLYPYSGLPGTRHSCIYPGQYNPSFISDDTRRRDYF